MTPLFSQRTLAALGIDDAKAYHDIMTDYLIIVWTKGHKKFRIQIDEHEVATANSKYVLMMERLQKSIKDNTQKVMAWTHRLDLWEYKV